MPRSITMVYPDSCRRFFHVSMPLRNLTLRSAKKYAFSYLSAGEKQKEHLFANEIHDIIKSVDKINIQKRTDFVQKTDHNAHSVYWRKSRMG